MTHNYTDNKIFTIIQDIIVEALRIDPSKVEPDARFIIDLGTESIDVLDIRFRIEAAFGFKISDGEVKRHIGEDLTAKEIEEKFTVGSLIDYVKERLAEKETV